MKDYLIIFHMGEFPHLTYIEIREFPYLIIPDTEEPYIYWIEVDL